MGLSLIVERIEWLLDNATECWCINDANDCLMYESGDDQITVVNNDSEKAIYILVSDEALVIPEMIFGDIYHTLAAYFISHEEIQIRENNVINLMEILHGDAI